MLLRTYLLPDGMTIEEAEMIDSQQGWKPSVRPTEREPHLIASNACITGNPDRTRFWASQKSPACKEQG